MLGVLAVLVALISTALLAVEGASGGHHGEASDVDREEVLDGDREEGRGDVVASYPPFPSFPRLKCQTSHPTSFRISARSFFTPARSLFAHAMPS